MKDSGKKVTFFISIILCTLMLLITFFADDLIDTTQVGWRKIYGIGSVYLKNEPTHIGFSDFFAIENNFRGFLTVALLVVVLGLIALCICFAIGKYNVLCCTFHMILIIVPVVLVLALPGIFDTDMEYTMSELGYYATSVHTTIGTAGWWVIGLGVVSFIVTLPAMVRGLEQSFQHSEKKAAKIKEKYNAEEDFKL